METSTEATGGQTPEELIAQIDELMEEAEALLVGPMEGQLAEEFHALRSRLHDLERLCGEACGHVVASARAADRAIRAHPYQSLAVALGAGVLLGVYLRRG